MAFYLELERDVFIYDTSARPEFHGMHVQRLLQGYEFLFTQQNMWIRTFVREAFKPFLYLPCSRFADKVEDLFYLLVPSRPPEQFKTTNKSSPTSIPLTWKPISNPFYIHGILLGYKIEFKMTHLAGNVLTRHDTTVVHTTGPNTLSHVLTGLEIYAVYRIKIRALTVKGDGVSTEISAGVVLSVVLTSILGF